MEWKNFHFFSILRSPAILRSRILRHKASALRLGQFSNFWEKLLKNLYSLMVTDMRRCILARVGSAVLALSPFVTVSKEEKGKEAKERGFHCTVFSFSFFLAVKIVDSHAACCHCTTLHFTTLHYRTLQRTWVAGVDASYIYRYCLPAHSTRLVHCLCVHRARRL